MLDETKIRVIFSSWLKLSWNGWREMGCLEMNCFEIDRLNMFVFLMDCSLCRNEMSCLEIDLLKEKCVKVN